MSNIIKATIEVDLDIAKKQTGNIDGYLDNQFKEMRKEIKKKMHFA